MHGEALQAGHRSPQAGGQRRRTDLRLGRLERGPQRAGKGGEEGRGIAALGRLEEAIYGLLGRLGQSALAAQPMATIAKASASTTGTVICFLDIRACNNLVNFFTGWHVSELAKGVAAPEPRPSQAPGRATQFINLFPNNT